MKKSEIDCEGISMNNAALGPETDCAEYSS